MFYRPRREDQRPAGEAKYNQLCMQVCTRTCTRHCGTICGRTRQKMHRERDLAVSCWVSWSGVDLWLGCLTETEKDVGGWLYNEVNLYNLKECQFLAIKLSEELIFLVTDMDQCMAGGWRSWVLRFFGLGNREIDAGQVFHAICFRRYQRTAYDFRGSVFQLVKNWAYYAKNLPNMISEI